MTYRPPKEEFDNLMKMVEVQAAKINRKYNNFIDREELISIGNLALCESLERYNPESLASAWTFCEQRVRGAMLDEIRKKTNPGIGRFSKKDPFTFEQYEETIEDITQIDDVYIEKIDIEKRLNFLTETQRNALVLHAQGFAQPEIGKNLGVGVSTVRRLLNEAKQLIADEN